VAVGLVHPHRTWLQALEILLGACEGVEVAIAHPDPRWVLNAVERGEVDVVVQHLGKGADAGAVVEMRQANGEVPVVVMSDRDDQAFITAVFRAGARGFLLESCSIDELQRTLHGVARGETWLAPRHLTRLVEGLLVADTVDEVEDDQLAQLSSREREILDCLVLGMRRDEIAERLFLSPNTVRTHIHNMLRKLQVHSTLEAVSIANGLAESRGGVEPSPPGGGAATTQGGGRGGPVPSA
jgi:DNA-binding NarL/FixJ family response regulator